MQTPNLLGFSDSQKYYMLGYNYINSTDDYTITMTYSIWTEVVSNGYW